MGKKDDNLDPILRFAFQGPKEEPSKPLFKEEKSDEVINIDYSDFKKKPAAKTADTDDLSMFLYNENTPEEKPGTAAKADTNAASDADKEAPSNKTEIPETASPAPGTKAEEKSAEDAEGDNEKADEDNAKSAIPAKDEEASQTAESEKVPSTDEAKEETSSDEVKEDTPSDETKADASTEENDAVSSPAENEEAAPTPKAEEAPAENKDNNSNDIEDSTSETIKEESTNKGIEEESVENKEKSEDESKEKPKKAVPIFKVAHNKAAAPLQPAETAENTASNDTEAAAAKSDISPAEAVVNATPAHTTDSPANAVQSAQEVAYTEAAPVQAEEPAAENPEDLLDLAFQQLAEERWQEASETLKRVIALAPATPRAYLGKILAKNQIPTEHRISECKEPIADDPDFKRATLYADAQYQLVLLGYDHSITDRLKKEKNNEKALAEKEKLYNEAMALKNNANDENSFLTAASRFRDISDYKDASKMAAECNKLAQQKFVEKGLKMERDRYLKAEANAAQRTKKKIIHLCIAGVAAVAVLAVGTLFGVDAIKKNSFISQSEGIRSQYSSTTIAAGTAHTVAIKNDGTVYSTGKNDDGQCDVSKWKDIVAIDAGDYHTVGLKADGTVVATGRNDEGQCDVKDWKDIKQIAVGDYHTVGLKSDGTVVATGRNDRSQSDVSSWESIEYISAGVNCTVGIKKDGSVICVGSSGDKSSKIPKWKNVVMTAVGDGVTIGLKNNGTVSVAYYTTPGNTSKWRKIIDVAASSDHIVAATGDGTAVAVGKNGNSQCNVEDWSNVVAVDAGYKFSIGLRDNGTLEVAGDNGDKQLDVADWVDIKTK